MNRRNRIPARARREWARRKVHRPPYEQTIFWLFLLGIAWVPAWYGSNILLAWGINAVLFPGLAGLYELSLLVRRRPHPVGLRHLAIPAGLFVVVVLWIAFQMMTWAPASLVNPIWGMTAAALGRGVAGSISVDRDLTSLALLRLVTAASVFWLALQLGRDGLRARRLLGAIACIGCLYAGYGFVVLKTGQLPWLDIPPAAGTVTSTFVNHNAFATFAGICAVVACGFMLAHYRGERVGGSGNVRHRIASFIEASGPRGAVAVAAFFVLLTAVLLTGSRGGAMSTGLALIVLGLLTRDREVRSRRPWGTIVFALALAVATGLAFGDLIGGKLEDAGITDTNRLAVFALTVRSICDNPLPGFGYGTFADVFPMYRDRSLSVDGIWRQAHNTYLELFQGLGVLFGAMLIASVVLLVVHCFGGARRRLGNGLVPQVAASAGCLVGGHALVDFSLQVQAVALTFAALLGAGVAQSPSSRVDLGD